MDIRLHTAKGVGIKEDLVVPALFNFKMLNINYRYQVDKSSKQPSDVGQKNEEAQSEHNIFGRFHQQAEQPGFPRYCAPQRLIDGAAALNRVPSPLIGWRIKTRRPISRLKTFSMISGKVLCRLVMLRIRVNLRHLLARILDHFESGLGLIFPLAVRSSGRPAGLRLFGPCKRGRWTLYPCPMNILSRQCRTSAVQSSRVSFLFGVVDCIPRVKL
jgi:hypothetical protein